MQNIIKLIRAKIPRSFTGKLIFGILLAHALLLPPLYIGAVRIITQGSQTQFIDYARSSALLLAQQLAAINLNKDKQALKNIVENFGHNVQVVFVRVESGTLTKILWKSPLHPYQENKIFREDIRIGENADNIYHIKVPVQQQKSDLTNYVYIGFDEFIVHAYITQLRENMILLLSAYVLILIAFTFAFGYRITAPLRRLNSAARAIARGKTDAFITPGYIIEINELAHSLELMRQQLTLERDTAQKANRSKSEFLSHMSHELRTPLNSILGFSQLMQTDVKYPLSADQRENLEEITRAGAHLLNLINDILDLARIEAGRLAINKTTFSLYSLLHECSTLMNPLAEKRRLLFNTSLAGSEKVLLNADYTRLKQVLLNLLSNAIKYNHDSGSVTLTFEYLPGSENQQLQIFVTDTGPGLSPEQLSQLFLPFERLGAETSDVEGTGIGLAISKKLIELMQGDIGVDCITDVGCRFWISVPCGLDCSLPEHSTRDVIPKPDWSITSNSVHH